MNADQYFTAGITFGWAIIMVAMIACVQPHPIPVEIGQPLVQIELALVACAVYSFFRAIYKGRNS